MELGKYIRAMRPKKYLTREFKVYDASMADDNIIDTMSTDAPPMDNVMPYTDGLEDPRNRQLQLADGGIVEREGFKDGINYNRNPGGSNQYKTKTLEEIQQIIEANPDLTAADLRGKGIKAREKLLTRDDLRRAKEAGIEPEKKGKHINPEKQRTRDLLRRESIKAKSSPAMEQAISGTKEKNLSHAGRKNTPVSLQNLMYADASLNRKMLYPFEKPLEKAMTKFEQVYNSDASPEVKRKAAFDLQKFDRTLRKKYPEYAKLKTRFQFKNSAFEPGFVFKERLPNPSLAISSEAGTSLQGVNPKSKKGEALVKIAEKKLETLINNIGIEKIKAGKLNNNEFNLLKKAIKTPAAQTALKYGKGVLKILGPVLIPLVAYDTFKSYKEGKPTFEILEEGLIGTGLARGIREAQTYTPEEREAIAQRKQYAREEEDYSGLSSDFNIPSNLSTDQIDSLSVTGPQRVAETLAAEDAARAAKRVYEGDPGFISETGYAVGGRVGFKKGSKDKDSPVIPISPLTDLPQNESRRDFLKGLGAAGLGALALGSGLLKLGKTAEISSKIASMVKNTTAPSWMEALVNKIIKEGTDIPIPKKPGSSTEKISIKELEFKNPETGKMEKVQLKIDETKDTVTVDYFGNNTVANQGVTLELVPKQKIVDKGNYLTPERVKDEYHFRALESEPRVSNFDGDIEFDAENYANKIIDLRSDISGLKSYVTGGKGIDKTVAKQKKMITEDIEKNPTDYIDDTYDYDDYGNR